jgi:hypothetical protein
VDEDGVCLPDLVHDAFLPLSRRAWYQAETAGRACGHG